MFGGAVKSQRAARRLGCLLFFFCLAGCTNNPEPPPKNQPPSRELIFDAAPSPELKKNQRSLAAYMAGLMHESNGEFPQAQADYEKANILSPNNSQILLRLGIVQMQRNQIAAALTSLKRVCELNSEDIRPRFLLGAIYSNQQRYDKATEQYAQILKREPADLGALTQLADLYILQEMTIQGIDIYERLLRERPRAPVAHFNLAVLYAKREYWKSAITHMRRALEEDPDYLEARLGLAVCLELSGDLPGADEQFRAVIQQQPANTHLMRVLARISYRMGNPEESHKWVTRYLSFNPNDAQAHLELAYLLIEMGRWEEAVVQAQRSLLHLVEGPETVVGAWVAEAVAYQNGGQYEQALNAFKSALAVNRSGGAEVRERLAVLFQKMGQYDQAEQVLKPMLDADPENPQLLNSLGYLYAERGRDLPKAERLLQKALKKDPENAAYLDSLGWVYFKMGKLQEAKSLLEQAAAKSKNSAVLEHLGRVYLLLKEIARAREVWEQALAQERSDGGLIHQLNRDLAELKGR